MIEVCVYKAGVTLLDYPGFFRRRAVGQSDPASDPILSVA